MLLKWQTLFCPILCHFSFLSVSQLVKSRQIPEMKMINWSPSFVFPSRLLHFQAPLTLERETLSSFPNLFFSTCILSLTYLFFWNLVPSVNLSIFFPHPITEANTHIQFLT